MNNFRKTIMLPIIGIIALIPIITITDIVTDSEVIAVAKTLSTTPTGKSGNNDFRNTKEFKVLEKRKAQQIADEKSTLLKADNIIPGIKEQWDAVMNERTEIIKLLTAKESDPKYKEGLSNNHRVKKNIDFGSSKIAGDDFSKAVNSEDKEKIKDTFNKFIILNKEINEQFRLMLNNN